MSIIAKADGGFVPAPEGQFLAVCADVVDLGMVTTEWEGRVKSVHKIRIVFLLDENMDDGRPFTVSQQFTLSLNEKANLRKFLQAWRGKPFTRDEMGGFDVEKLIGAPALVQIVHAEKGDKVYANVDSIMKAPKGATVPKIPSDYVRAKDRDRKPSPVGTISDFTAALEEEDDDLPF